MLNRKLANTLFDSFSIHRWGDRVRPIDLTLIDKHAHKAVLTFIIASMEEAQGKKVDWLFIVNGLVFGIMEGIALSDIKSPVIDRIKKEYPEQIKELNQWVKKQYEHCIEDTEFLKEFEVFLDEKSTSNEFELSIIAAANKYSSLREFEIIKPANESFPEINVIECKLNDDISKLPKFAAMYQLTSKAKLYEALCIIEQLRYQTRWSRTPRVPLTSVLGHSMYVALLAYFISRDLDVCSKRLINNFYAALFHDLPESVTRDIISPVKRATPDFPGIIKDVENKICEEELYPKLPDYITKRLKYLIGDLPELSDEFSNRIITKGKVVDLQEETLDSKYNKDEYDPIDGKLIKLCDSIAAFMEVTKSQEYGITSQHIKGGISELKSIYENETIIHGFNVRKFFDEELIT